MKNCLLLFLLLCGCGQMNPGDTDRKLDCIDGCSPQQSPSPSPKDGKDGQSCTVAAMSNGAIITCGTTSTVILNGAKGTDGSNGKDAPPTAYSVVEMIDPCGAQSQFDEVLLRLANNQLIAHFSNGSNQFLTVIGPGSYITTDGTSCHFTIDTELGVHW